MAQTAPYGTWESPISAELLTAKNVSISGVQVDHVTGAIYYGEGRPHEGGRIAIVEQSSGKDVIGKDYNARSGVHEYGGGSFAVRDGVVYFTDFATMRIFQVKDGKNEAICPDNKSHRFADFEVHPTNPHCLVTILEDHTKPDPADVVNSIVQIDIPSKTVCCSVASGADFYSNPRFNQDGTKICWIQWYHPDMPWEGSELVIADVDPSSCKITNELVVAGKRGETSVTQAQWISHDVLGFISDKNGFSNPYLWSASSGEVTAILKTPAEQEYAEPAWTLGGSEWTVLDSDTLLVSPTINGVASLALLQINSGKLTRISTPYVTIGSVHAIGKNKAVFVGEQDDFPSSLVLVRLPPFSSSNESSIDPLKLETLKATSTIINDLPKGLIPIPQTLALPVGDNGAPLHVMYFPPTNAKYLGGSDGELPPCVVHIHGGPTARVPPGLSWGATYFTSRGWAWVVVNYGGSSGFGREYRDRLQYKWGIVDVDDSVTAVVELGKRGLIDTKRAAIRGGSAGGFTVLATLVNQPTAFAAGTSSYGVSDLALLEKYTHKFESKYLERLIGKGEKVYRERSPVYHADKIESPLLILQGSVDAVVPPAQAEVIVKSIRERNGDVEYVVFEGEGHGWRKAENIKAALEKEEAFYRRVFKIHN